MRSYQILVKGNKFLEEFFDSFPGWHLVQEFHSGIHPGTDQEFFLNTLGRNSIQEMCPGKIPEWIPGWIPEWIPGPELVQEMLKRTDP